MRLVIRRSAEVELSLKKAAIIRQAFFIAQQEQNQHYWQSFEQSGDSELRLINQNDIDQVSSDIIWVEKTLRNETETNGTVVDGPSVEHQEEMEAKAIKRRFKCTI